MLLQRTISFNMSSSIRRDKKSDGDLAARALSDASLFAYGVIGCRRTDPRSGFLAQIILFGAPRCAAVTVNMLGVSSKGQVSSSVSVLVGCPIIT